MAPLVVQTSFIQHHVTLNRSPLILAPILEAFFVSLQPSANSILLGYLVLPIVLYPSSQKFLKNANSTSSIRTYCGDMTRLAGLSKRIIELRSVSSLAMQHCIDSRALTLQKDLSLVSLRDERMPPNGRSIELKAANRLAAILDPYDVPTAYRLLGVRNL